MLISETLYQEILKVMPIPCVDLIVQNQAGHILMLKRSNEPAKGQWWFPGGRVHFGELRVEAAKRKLHEECGLVEPCSITEIGTYDVLLSLSGGNMSHGITTVFHVIVDNQILKIDKQSSDYKWENPGSWLRKLSDKFLIVNLQRLEENNNAKKPNYE